MAYKTRQKYWDQIVDKMDHESCETIHSKGEGVGKKILQTPNKGIQIGVFPVNGERAED